MQAIASRSRRTRFLLAPGGTRCHFSAENVGIRRLRSTVAMEMRDAGRGDCVDALPVSTKTAPKGRSFANREERALFFLAVRQFFANTCRLARAIAQVVELGSANISLALDLDAGKQRRVRLKGSLDAFAA